MAYVVGVLLVEVVQRAHPHVLKTSSVACVTTSICVYWADRTFIADVKLSIAFLVAFGLDHLHVQVANTFVDLERTLSLHVWTVVTTHQFWCIHRLIKLLDL